MLIAIRADMADMGARRRHHRARRLRFDGSDPRFTGEMMQGPLDPGSGAFGGDHWAEEYAAIREGNAHPGRVAIGD